MVPPMPPATALRPKSVRAARTRAAAPRGDKRDAILRAAIDVFAARGFFNAQVADVARAAGVAAGTVYLYFRSKDDLLVSIFERTMREAIAEGRAARRRPRAIRASGCARSRALHLDRLGRDRNLAVVFQVELRQSTKFMERFSATLLRDYLGLIRDVIADGQATGVFRADINADARGQDVLRRARRNGDQLDPQPPQVLARGRRRRGRRPLRQRRAARDERPHARSDRSAVLGAGTMGAQIAAHFANAGVPVAAARRHRRRRARGLKRARALKPDPFFTPDAARADHDRRLRRRPRRARRRRLDHRSGRRAARRQAARCSSGSTRVRRPARSSARTRPAFRSRRSPKGAATTSGGTGSARTSSTRRATCTCSSSSRPPTPTRPSSTRVARFADHRLGKGVVVAKDTPNFIAQPHRRSTASCRCSQALETRRATRSKRSTRSPARRSAGRRARRSGRWTSPASTCSAHVARNLAERLRRARRSARSRCRRSSTQLVAARTGSARRPARASTRRRGRARS